MTRSVMNPNKVGFSLNFFQFQMMLPDKVIHQIIYENLGIRLPVSFTVGQFRIIIRKNNLDIKGILDSYFFIRRGKC